LEWFVTIVRDESARGARATLQRWRVTLGFAAGIAFLVFSGPSWRSVVLGAPIAAVGVSIRTWASGVLKKNEELTTGGPYAYTRNPLYGGSFLMTIGCAVAGGSWWLGVMLVGLFLIVYTPVMMAEDAHLGTLFGEEHRRYAKSVPTFVPRLSRYSGASGRGFDVQLYLRHREYQALIGLAMIFVVLSLKASGVLRWEH
jgi:protein-S-isoprenylcysteine O-methyltransferase Ste14